MFKNKKSCQFISEYRRGLLITERPCIVEQGQVGPVEAKVESISDLPSPTGKRQLVRFLGMAEYYRKFCNNFSVIAESLTNLLYDKNVRYVWTEACQRFVVLFGSYLEVIQYY